MTYVSSGNCQEIKMILAQNSQRSDAKEIEFREYFWVATKKSIIFTQFLACFLQFFSKIS